jgi:hypothetical protein
MHSAVARAILLPAFSSSASAKAICHLRAPQSRNPSNGPQVGLAPLQSMSFFISHHYLCGKSMFVEGMPLVIEDTMHMLQVATRKPSVDVF